MCGLSVALGATEREMTSANARMRHRGTRPTFDRAGAWGLSRVRLPIVGLDDGFDPPYEHRGWTFNFVGEIVNFRQIAPSARCDVEVLARRFVDIGPACVREFDGFWSIAAVAPQGDLFVLTDFLGKKPLYHRTDRVAYASEIRTLGAYGPLTPDPVYFSSVRKWGYHAGDRTWAREVRKMAPGTLRHHRPLDGGEVLEHRGFDSVEPDASVNLFCAVEAAVRRRVLSSDVPVAMLLSGGLDSSIVYLLAQGLRSDLRVYHAPNDEADYLGLLGVMDGETIEFDDYPADEVLRANEGPVDLGSVWPQYALGQAIGERVALSGDGADELFGGYRRAMTYDSQGSDVWEELVHYHLPRLDKLMMAGTVELRSPFLARDVVRAALALPHRRRTQKQALKEAFADLVPKAILDRPKMALKTRAVIDGGVERRMRLCDEFEDMIRSGVAT